MKSKLFSLIGQTGLMMALTVALVAIPKVANGQGGVSPYSNLRVMIPLGCQSKAKDFNDELYIKNTTNSAIKKGSKLSYSSYKANGSVVLGSDLGPNAQLTVKVTPYEGIMPCKAWY